MISASSIIGILAAIFTTVAYIPQTIKILKTKETKAISRGMYILITLGIFLWLVYGLMIMDYPIIIANALTLIMATTILVVKLKNG